MQKFLRPPSRLEQQAAYERRISIIKDDHYPKVDWHERKPCGPICPLNSPGIHRDKYSYYKVLLPSALTANFFLSFPLRSVRAYPFLLSSLSLLVGFCPCVAEYKMHKLFDDYDKWKLTEFSNGVTTDTYLLLKNILLIDPDQGSRIYGFWNFKKVDTLCLS